MGTADTQVNWLEWFERWQSMQDCVGVRWAWDTTWIAQAGSGPQGWRGGGARDHDDGTWLGHRGIRWDGK